jgi:hypothetical protein
MRHLILGLLLACSVLGGCAPCTDYCEEQCLCDGQGDAGEANASCVETCLDTLELYSPDVRKDECTARLGVLQEECR